MNTLHHTSVDALQESPLQASGEVVYLLPADMPVATAAERFMKLWEPRRKTAVILVPEARQAAFLTALRPRVHKLLSDSSIDGETFADFIRQIADGGACLLCGGHDLRPALASNLLLNRSLLSRIGAPLPMVMVGTLEENTAEMESLSAFLRELSESA